MTTKTNMVTRLVYKPQSTKTKLLKYIYTKLCSLCGADTPESVAVGRNVQFCHNCLGTVIYKDTTIGNDVLIYQNVTIGQADPFNKNPAKFIIEDGVVLSAGAKILGKNDLRVGRNSIVAANAV